MAKGFDEDSEPARSLWKKAKRDPTESETKVLLGVAIKIAIVTAMGNHVFKFDNKLLKQGAGGVIGLDLTRAIARCYMLWWDAVFIKEVKLFSDNSDSLDLSLEDYTRLADDEFLISESLKEHVTVDLASKKLVKNDVIVMYMETVTNRPWKYTRTLLTTLMKTSN